MLLYLLNIYGRYIAIRKESLWIRWVNHIYIKDSDWWSYHPSNAASWCWKEFCKIKDMMRAGYSGRKWTADQNKGYSPASGYKWLRGAMVDVWWSRWVWCRGSIPKHSFMSWLAIQDRLKTRDRLSRFGIGKETSCVLCLTKEESCEHLFFECEYSQICLKEWKNRLQLKGQWGSIHQLAAWCIRRTRGVMKRRLILASLNGLVYCIWIQRNLALWHSCIKSPSYVVNQMINDVKARVRVTAGTKELAKELGWLEGV